jgi:transcriptional regulator with XRE-family HTH domain
MSTLVTINELLDAAKKVTGSDYKTAKALGVPTTHISNWRHGGRNPQPEDLALIAGLAGLDAEAVLVRAIIDKHRNTSKGERLMSVLGNVLRRTGEAVTLGFFASVGLGSIQESARAATTAIGKAVATMCIM